MMRACNPPAGRLGAPGRTGSAAALFACLLAAAPARAMPSPPAAGDSAARQPSLAVLDPVDLKTRRPDSAAGAALRRALAENPSWRVPSGDSLRARLRGLGLRPAIACVEFQCAFDAGSATQSEFVLFGTSTGLPEIRSYTLELAHIPTAQIVWSRTGQTAGTGSAHGPEPLGRSLRASVSDLDPGALDLRKPSGAALLGVVDGGPSTPRSRVILHRALAHAYGARRYDVLGPEELEGLAAALDSAPAGNPDDVMLALGRRMGMHYLLRSSLRPEVGKYALDLSLWDVASGKAIRSRPSPGAAEFPSLLEDEDRFMTALDGAAPPSRARSRHRKPYLKAATLALAAAGSGALGYLAWESHSRAERAYADFRASRTRAQADAARRRVLAEDSQVRRLGLLGGLTLGLGAAIWTF